MQTETDLYNKAYSKFTPDYIQLNNISKINEYFRQNSESLTRFFDQYCEQFDLGWKTHEMSCLELGCGIGSLSYYLNSQFSKFVALDHSSLAISTAKDICQLKEEYVDFQLFDVCSDLELDDKYQFIVDSHLFHCLTKAEDRKAYINFIKKHLSEDGYFLLETMAFHPKIQVPVGYDFSEDYVLSKNFEGSSIPIRSIKPSRSLEEEFKEAGLVINYLYYHNELSFDVFEEYENYPLDFLPKTIRLSARLS